MTVLAWIAYGLALWVAVSVAVALIFGRVLRNRDRQIPR